MRLSEVSCGAKMVRFVQQVIIMAMGIDPLRANQKRESSARDEGEEETAKEQEELFW